MNILHFSNKPMYPVLDGGCAAMASLYRCLDQVGTADHIYLATPKHPYVQDAYPRDLPVPLKQLKVDTRIRPFSALWALVRGKNYNLSRFVSGNVVLKISHLLEKKSYDVVVLESLFLANYVPVFRAAGVKTIIIRAHNVEHTLWEQWAAQTTGWKKIYLNWLARTLKRDEIKLLNQVDAIWAITDADEVLLRAIAPKVPVSHVRVAVDIGDASADYSKSDIFHVGSLNWQPNKAAVARLEHLWQRLDRPAHAKLHIVGSFASGHPKPVHESIIHYGFVPDLPHFMQQHGILCSPVTMGSGVRIKLLEAMAMGVPCVTTPLGAAGITHTEAVMLVAESDDELIKAMETLLSDERLRAKLGSGGKEYARKYHSFTAVTSQLRNLLGV